MGEGEGSVQEETLTVKIFVYDDGGVVEDDEALSSYALQFNEVPPSHRLPCSPLPSPSVRQVAH